MGSYPEIKKNTFRNFDTVPFPVPFPREIPCSVPKNRDTKSREIGPSNYYSNFCHYSATFDRPYIHGLRAPKNGNDSVASQPNRYMERGVLGGKKICELQQETGDNQATENTDSYFSFLGFIG